MFKWYSILQKLQTLTKNKTWIILYSMYGSPCKPLVFLSLRWRHNDHAGVSNHQPHGCLLNRLFMRKSKKTSKLRVTGLCVGNSPGTGEFPAQMASYAENVSIWWRHHVIALSHYIYTKEDCTICNSPLIIIKDAGYFSKWWQLFTNTTVRIIIVRVPRGVWPD